MMKSSRQRLLLHVHSPPELFEPAVFESRCQQAINKRKFVLASRVKSPLWVRNNNPNTELRKEDGSVVRVVVPGVGMPGSKPSSSYSLWMWHIASSPFTETMTRIFPTLFRVVKVISIKEVDINVNTGIEEEAWCRQGNSRSLYRHTERSRARHDGKALQGKLCGCWKQQSHVSTLLHLN